ncbi:MAG: hypothetical protein ACI89D_001612, partial [Bermanella sp.]
MIRARLTNPPFALSLWFDKLTTNGRHGRAGLYRRIKDSRMKLFWVYIVRCADNSCYTGHTDNLERR